MIDCPLIIGTDESGKGDFFGPLVVAGFCCADEKAAKLAALGVRDSKKITDGKLVQIDENLRADFPHFVLILSPEEYNTRYKEIKNLNRLLADCHADVLTQLCRTTGATRAVSDKFGKSHLIEEALQQRECRLQLRQLVRGERIPQVAAASILARAAFVREMARLSDKYGIEIPKGAAPQVDRLGRELVRLFGVDELVNVAKLHFKNYRRVVDPRLAV